MVSHSAPRTLTRQRSVAERQRLIRCRIVVRVAPQPLRRDGDADLRCARGERAETQLVGVHQRRPCALSAHSSGISPRWSRIVTPSSQATPSYFTQSIDGAIASVRADVLTITGEVLARFG
jgi:type II secretory pathway component PulJ